MTKRYFGPKRKNEPSLFKIILAIAVVMGLAAGGVYLAGRMDLSLPLPGTRTEDHAPETLAQARESLAGGAAETARELLGPILEEVDNADITPAALLLQAEADVSAGDPAAAATHLQRLMDRYPASPEAPEATLRYARMIEDDGRLPEAYALYKELEGSAPPALRAAALLGLARKAEREEGHLAARPVYEQALKDAVPRERAWEEAVDALGRINVMMIFSADETPESKYHEVEKGETLTRIGVKLNTTQGLLTRANGIDDPSRLRLGQRLKYTPKDFRILIERSTCTLYLLDKDGLFKRYRVGLGMPGYETTLGSYTVGNKEKDPTWWKPGAKPIPPGDPRNELGTRWMPLVPVEAGLPRDLGIHGTIAPETIGLYKSHGCPRLFRAEVEELYDLVVRSTPVTIIEHADLSPLA